MFKGNSFSMEQNILDNVIQGVLGLNKLFVRKLLSNEVNFLPPPLQLPLR